MLRSPRIAIPVPTSFDPAYNQQSWPEYARAVEQSGGEAVRIQLGQPALSLTGVLNSCDGVLLPGSGADVAPERYGHAREIETASADTAREEIDLLLLERLEREGKPLLAICFGLQSLNVYRGGTLVQHLQPVPVNHRAGRSVIGAHAAKIAPGSRLASIADLENAQCADKSGQEGSRIMVNSSHHQAVGTPGENLQVVARSAEDAVIEALEDPSRPWMLGVQWHPERTMEHSATSRALFQQFIAAARERH